MCDLGKRFSPFVGVGLAACLISFFIVAPALADEYYVKGNLYANAHGVGTPINRDIPAGAATSVADSATQTGSSGNTATASYYADLATGSLGTYVFGYGPYANMYDGGGARVNSTVHMYDRIYVTIPAGTYDQDLYAVLNGHIEGVISTFGYDGNIGSLANHTWLFSFAGKFGGDGLFSDHTPNVYPDMSPYVVNQDFTLTARILYAGTLSSERIVQLSVRAKLESVGAARWTYPYGDPITS
ncbi:MAG: hypothetical protein KAV00_18355, partial [Phycisphaerae bacterium]|nr:hypothetical protein [Phycisphaerae bacterium]